MDDCHNDLAWVAPDSQTTPEGESRDHLVEDFITSMPKRYRHEFGRASARQHARIAAARGRHPIHADLFGAGSADRPGLCVVAPDAPGLLALVSTGLMLEGFDITRADAYTRRAASGDYEAVDLFWIRRLPPERFVPLRDAELAALRSTSVSSLVAVAPASAFNLRSLELPRGTSETSVRFHENYVRRELASLGYDIGPCGNRVAELSDS